MAKSGIRINPANKGKLHAKLGVPKGEKIPASKIGDTFERTRHDARSGKEIHETVRKRRTE